MAAVLSFGLFAASACAKAPELRGRIDGLSEVADRAEANGALKCAPRELAMARAHLRFAGVALDRGEVSSAEAHLVVAEPNAKAAFAESPADRCVTVRRGDRDGDGIPDDIDRCPDVRETWNTFEDEDGCPDDPDTDGDGIPDSLDACLLEPEDVDGYLDSDGCPDRDNDADGIADAVDRCPNEKEDPDGFEDEDGCPDPDNDKDTVADVDDQCPNTPGVPGGERPGCPRKHVVVTAREIRITQQIQFEFNKAVIKPDSFGILDEVRDVLRENPQIKIEVQGHTDNVGGAAYNAKLSQSRADAVRKYLVAHGVEAHRLTSKGYGMSQPLVPNNSEANRALNRRVQFIRTEAP
jgi:outer membrane protein OmpA-like peptidoglycan-associated protein